MPRTLTMETQATEQTQASPFAWAGGRERKQIAIIKRFLEILAADPGLGADLRAHPGRERESLARRGLDFDPAQVEPMWRKGFNPRNLGNDASGLPLIELWQRWQASWEQYRRDLRVIQGAPTQLTNWRTRQMIRSQLELGGHEHNLTYPVMAFELSRGCSMGCWFCAFDAPRLSAVFRRTPEGAGLWREVLETCLELLGPEAVGSGPCYWATEPADNPDFLELLRDFVRLTGRLGPTTTAAATRDPHETRELLQLYQGRPGLRFSVLSLEMLGRIHLAYTPDELLFVECLAQNQESVIPKTHSGRAREDARWLKTRQAARAGLAPGPAGALDPRRETTACLAGYKVNMCDKSVELISPCPPSSDHPLGYRIQAKGGFASPGDLGRFIRRTMDECMPQGPGKDQTLGLLPGLAWRERDGRLEFYTEVARLGLPLSPALEQILPLLDRGGLNSGQIMEQAQEEGVGLFEAMAALELLFQRGLLDHKPGQGAG